MREGAGALVALYGVQTLHLVEAMPSAVVEPEIMFLGAMALNLLLLLPESPDLSLSHLWCFPSP